MFNGRRALQREQAQGSRYRFALLDVDGTSRPITRSFSAGAGKVGTVTSAAWCPTAKSNVAFAQLEMPHGAVGRSSSPGFITSANCSGPACWHALPGYRVTGVQPPRRRAVPPGAF